jgi:uncharacterized protein (TIGR00251 family)
MADLNLQENDGSVTFEVRVIPRSSKSEIVGELDGALKIKLKAPPVDGAANDELVRLIAKELDMPRSSIEIVSGHSSKKKRVCVNGVSARQILAILNAKS